MLDSMDSILRTVGADWFRRRTLVAATLTPVIATGLALASGVNAGDLSATWLLLALVAATLSAAVLASYVPRRGLRPELGCTPCAAMSVLTVLGGIIAVANYGASFLGPLVATAVTLFGLTQRLGQVQVCTAPAQVKSDSLT